MAEDNQNSESASNDENNATESKTMLDKVADLFRQSDNSEELIKNPEILQNYSNEAKILKIAELKAEKIPNDEINQKIISEVKERLASEIEQGTNKNLPNVDYKMQERQHIQAVPQEQSMSRDRDIEIEM